MVWLYKSEEDDISLTSLFLLSIARADGLVTVWLQGRTAFQRAPALKKWCDFCEQLGEHTARASSILQQPTS